MPLKENLLQKKKLYHKKNFPNKYLVFSLELKNFKQYLKGINQEKIIKIPNSKGELKRFSIKETMYLAPQLAAKYPMIKSYSAQGIDDPTATAKISIGTDGVHAVVFSGKESTIYIDPFTKDNKEYIVYKRNDLDKKKNDFSCEVEETTKDVIEKIKLENRNANDGKLRTYRIAIASTGEYSQFHLNRQGIAASATDAVKKAAVLSAMVTTMTRVNGVYEKDLAVRMIIVNNNDKIIFLDANTDGLSNSNANSLISESQVKCDTEIGTANYDIGHTFSTGGGGLAGLGVVCVAGQKGRGITGSSQPVNDPYDIDFVAHELGHQFGATHTQNNSCNRTNSTAVEPGSGSTIMGYAGICTPNVQNNSDDHFHAVSIAQMWNIVQSSGNCATQTDTNNASPVANAGADYSIPKSTPFVLKGSATDADGLSGLTYNWEQIDTEIATMPPLATNSAGPAFRSLPSKDSPNRYMPDLATVVAGNTSSTWEVVPSVSRDMNFALTVRDNHSGGGASARDDMKISVTNAEAFIVTSQAVAETWETGTTKTITWNKGTTDVAPINCQTVNIKLSTDGGLTFPITILANTPNDGSQTITVPNNPTTKARIMVEAADNIFYNVNSTNLTINSTQPTFLMTNNSGSKSACNSGNNTVTYTIDFELVNGFSETISLTASGAPSGSNVSFDPATINANGSVTMTVSNFNGANQQDYTIIVTGTSNSVTQTADAFLKILGASFSNITLTSPAVGSTDVAVNPQLQWGADTNATSYDVVVATDNAFSNVIVSGNVTTNIFNLPQPLSSSTTYYWTVTPKNSCGEGTASSIGSFTTGSCTACNSSGNTSFNTSTTLVKFNTINNTSAKPSGYSDYTSISTTVKRDEEHELTVNANTDGNYVTTTYVWIDWNQNCTLDDSGEEYILGDVSNSTNGVTSLSPLKIKVPSEAKLGNTIMRVSTKYKPDGVPSPCETGFDGEVEDYKIVVEDNPASVEDFSFGNFKLYPNPSNGEFNLTFKVINTDKVSVKLHDFRGRLIGRKEFTNVSSDFSERLRFDNVRTGLYLLQITNGDKQTTKKILIH